MTMGKTYDVVVIGAGSVGVPAALALARAGLSVLVLDEMASPGQLSNKKAIGGIRATHSDFGKIRVCQRSIEIFAAWKEAEGDEIGWLSNGYSYPAYSAETEKKLKDLMKVQHSFGLNIRWVSPAEYNELVPGISMEGLRGSTYSPEDGSASPLLAVNAFYFKSLAAGAEYRFGEKVTALRLARGPGRRRGHRQGRIRLRPGDQRRRQQRPRDRPPGRPRRPGRARQPRGGDHRAGAALFRPDGGRYPPRARFGQLLLLPEPRGTGGLLHHPRPADPGSAPRVDLGVLPAGGQAHGPALPAPGLAARAPLLARPVPDDPGRFPDRRPRPPAVENYIHAVGMCGQGFMLGPGLGELLTRIATNAGDRRRRPHPAEFSSGARLCRRRGVEVIRELPAWISFTQAENLRRSSPQDLDSQIGQDRKNNAPQDRTRRQPGQ